jgi:nicotinate-nucleotide adenylyltransferase
MAGLKALLGIYGGTFDPPHNGHLVLAEAALDQLCLSQIIWILTRRSPLKTSHSITPVEIRLEMLQAALEGQFNFVISRVEIDRPPPYYALDTVRLLKFTYPDNELVYLIGGDLLNELPSWYKPEALIESVYAIGVLPRPGCNVNLENLYEKLPGLQNKIEFINSPPVDISASMLRDKIRQRIAYRHLLPKGVADIIDKYHLYQDTEG